MKLVWLAAVSFVWLIEAERAQTSTLREWPAVDNWATGLFSTPQRGSMCSVFAKASSDGVINVILTNNATHLYLNPGRAPLPANLPGSLMLSVDSRAICEVPILSAAPTNGIPSIMADLPGTVLAQTVAPAFLHTHTMQVDLSKECFIVDVLHFSKVLGEMREFSNVAIQMFGI